MAGYLTKPATHAMLTLMTGSGEDTVSGTDPVADRLMQAHLVRHWDGGSDAAPGVWVPKDYLLALLDQVDALGSAAVRADISSRPDDPDGRLFLALCTSDPGDVASTLLPESTASGYQRQPVSLVAPKNNGQFTYASGVASEVDLSGNAVFGPFTDQAGSGGALTHMALVTAATGTDIAVLAVWPLDAPVTAGQGDSLLVTDGTLTIKVA